MAATRTPTRQEVGAGVEGSEPLCPGGENAKLARPCLDLPPKASKAESHRDSCPPVFTAARSNPSIHGHERTTRCSVCTQWTVIRHGSTLRPWCGHWRTNTVGSTYQRSPGDAENAVAGARGWGRRGPVCNGDSVSAREDKKVLEAGGGDGCTTI